MPKKKLTKHQANKQKRQAEPFLLLDSDPANFGEGFSKNLKRTRPHLRGVSGKNFHRGKLRKSLTMKKKGSIIERVKKAKRKDDKMAVDKNKKANKVNGLKSLAWLTFAAQQAFIGYVLLSNFNNYVVVACALASLGMAGLVVIAHFFKAHK